MVTLTRVTSDEFAAIAKMAMAKLSPEEQQAIRATTLGAITAVRNIWVAELRNLIAAVTSWDEGPNSSRDALVAARDKARAALGDDGKPEVKP